jgi:hypothetical protein
MATTLKPLYGSSVALTVTSLGSLATDANLLAGWQSAVQDNTSNLYDDCLLTAVPKTGTSPTVSTTIEVWVYGTLDDTPTYPDTITGSVGTATLTSANTKNAGLALAAVITVDATSNRSYSLRPTSVAQLFGGVMPKKWGVFIVHNTGAALNATQVVSFIPVQFQSV